MDLHHMRYVTTIAKYGTMTLAAAELHVSQSAVSLALRAIQEELGVRLFRKHGRILELTDAGKLFCMEADSILSHTDRLVRDMQQYRTELNKSIHVSSDAVDFSNQAILLAASLFPDNQFIEIRSNTGETRQTLLTGKADLSLTLTDLNDEQIESELLLDEPMYALVSISSPLAAQKEISLAQLDSLPLVIQPEGYATHTQFLAFLGKAGVQPGTIIQVMDPETIVLQVSMQNAVSFIPQSTYHFNLRNFNWINSVVNAAPVREKYCRRQVFMSKRRDLYPSESVRVFSEFLERFGMLSQSLHCLPDKEDFVKNF